MKAFLFIGIFTAFIYIVGLIVEIYKKYIRKGNTHNWENRLVAFVFSFGLGYVMYRVFPISSIAGTMTEPSVFDALAYGAAIYVLQLPACLAIWKPLVKEFMARKMKSL